MIRKIPMLFLALMFGLVVNIAVAQDSGDYEDTDNDDTIVLQQIDDEDDGYGGGELLEKIGRGRRGRGSHMGLRGMRRKRMSGFFVPIVEELNVTEAQKNEFIDIMVDAYRQRLTLGIAQIEAVQKLSKEEQSETPDHDAILSLSIKIGEVKGRRAVLGHESRQKIWNILTPEQREMVREMQEDIDSANEEVEEIEEAE